MNPHRDRLELCSVAIGLCEKMLVALWKLTPAVVVLQYLSNSSSVFC